MRNFSLKRRGFALLLALVFSVSLCGATLFMPPSILAYEYYNRPNPTPTENDWTTSGTDIVPPGYNDGYDTHDPSYDDWADPGNDDLPAMVYVTFEHYGVNELRQTTLLETTTEMVPSNTQTYLAYFALSFDGYTYASWNQIMFTAYQGAVVQLYYEEDAPPVSVATLVVSHMAQMENGSYQYILDDKRFTGIDLNVTYTTSYFAQNISGYEFSLDPADNPQTFSISAGDLDGQGEYHMALLYKKQKPEPTPAPTTQVTTQETTRQTTAAPTTKPTKAEKKEETKEDDKRSKEELLPEDMTPEAETHLIIEAVDKKTNESLAEAHFYTNTLLWTYLDLGAKLALPAGYKICDPPKNEKLYSLKKNKENHITLYACNEADLVLVQAMLQLSDGSFHFIDGYDIKKLGKLKKTYSFDELAAKINVPSWAEWNEKLNHEEYTLSEEANVQVITLFLRLKNGNIEDEVNEGEKQMYLVRHWGRLAGSYVYLDFEVGKAEPGTIFKLKDLLKDFTPYFEPAGQPPNQAEYKLSWHQNIFDVFYDYGFLHVTPPGSCKKDKCKLPPPILIWDGVCDGPGPFCFETPPQPISPPNPGTPPHQPKPTPPGKKPPKKVINEHEWSGKYDVIVYGLDAAGAVAALAAAEEGADVFIIEKNAANATGGYTKTCPQKLLYSEDLSAATKFFSALRGDYDHLSDEMIEVLATGVLNVPAWLNEHGAANVYDLNYVPYEELPGGDAMKLLTLTDQKLNDAAFYNLLLQNLMDLKEKKGRYKNVKGTISYAYQCQLLELIQDPKTKTVLGVEVEQKGKKYKLRAKRGVILSSGGFESNETMVENFLQMPEALSRYDVTADGEGLKSAMAIGADLWHMGNVAGYDLHFRPLGSLEVTDRRRNLQGFYEDQLGDRSCFVIGPNGRRFTDESAELRLGHWNPAGFWVAQQIPPKAWVIFDEAGLSQGPLYPGWSADNMTEVQKAWILKASTMTELASILGVDDLDFEDQFLDYQDYCDAGYDSQMHRPQEYLHKLAENGPYYALPLYPTIHHTLGGPLKNAAGEVLDVNGQVIPRLYSCGNLGSVFADVYPGGADLSECIILGEIAGRNAAKKK